MRETDCADTKGILRVIQSIPSPKVEPFKRWLAEVGQDRIEEIRDPDKAIDRARQIYRNKGHSEGWIRRRVSDTDVRRTLTGEWSNRGAQTNIDFAILTNEIYRGIFNVNSQGLRVIKNLSPQDNSRDHMNALEARDLNGLPSLVRDAKEGSNIVGQVRKQIEEKTGKAISCKIKKPAV
jgi:hypothetical protein